MSNTLSFYEQAKLSKCIFQILFTMLSNWCYYRYIRKFRSVKENKIALIILLSGDILCFIFLSYFIF